MELRKIRRGTDISMKVSLTDSGIAVDWTTVEIKAVRVFSDAQKLTVADAAYEIDGDDTKILNVSYPGDGQCYLGTYRIVIDAVSDGKAVPFDLPAFELVATTMETTGGDPGPVEPIVVDIGGEVVSVDTGIAGEIMQGAVDAAQSANDAAKKAEEAAAKTKKKRTQQVIAGRCLPIKAMVGDIYRMCEIIIKRDYFIEGKPDRIDEYDLTGWRELLNTGNIKLRDSKGKELSDQNIDVIGLNSFSEYNTSCIRMCFNKVYLVQVLPYDKNTGIYPENLEFFDFNHVDMMACTSPYMMFNEEHIFCTIPPITQKPVIHNLEELQDYLDKAVYYTYDGYVRKYRARRTSTGWVTVGRKPKRRWNDGSYGYLKPLQPRKNAKFGKKYHVRLYKMLRGRYPYLFSEFDYLQSRILAL